MLKKLKRLTCRHAYIWSERRQKDVCYNCGRARPVDPVEAADAAAQVGQGPT